MVVLIVVVDMSPFLFGIGWRPTRSLWLSRSRHKRTRPPCGPWNPAHLDRPTACAAVPRCYGTERTGAPLVTVRRGPAAFLTKRPLLRRCAASSARATRPSRRIRSRCSALSVVTSRSRIAGESGIGTSKGLNCGMASWISWGSRGSWDSRQAAPTALRPVAALANSASSSVWPALRGNTITGHAASVTRRPDTPPTRTACIGP